MIPFHYHTLLFPFRILFDYYFLLLFSNFYANKYLTFNFKNDIIIVQMFGGIFMEIFDKLKILADSAKYDASCSSSGSKRKNTNTGIGNGNVSGICHSWGADR